MKLMEHQIDAIEKLGNGKVLYGNVGSGKSITALGYYMKFEAPKHIFVITTAKKRDSLDWEKEAAKFGLSSDLFLEDEAYLKHYGILTVDSWNNLKNYTEVEDAFFIFDEQRVVGHGSWVKSFLKITKNNNWILLSATPGDGWMDYAPIFIANGYYKNITEFKYQHVLYEPFSKYPKIRMFLNETKLELLRNEVLVEMPYFGEAKREINWMYESYDKEKFQRVLKDRWNIYENRPIKDAAELFRLMRRVVNSDPSRLELIQKLMTIHPRLIVFYNFNYELDILRTIQGRAVFEYNGHKKDPLPESDEWVYLVQYVAGAEGWNCTSTDAMVLYSLTYSYKNFEQAQGRIDRLDTIYTTLFYYVLLSNSVIDRGIKERLVSKKSFNERKFFEKLEDFGENLEENLEVCQI